MERTQTPRTNEINRSIQYNTHCYVEMANFARQLERELSQARKDAERLRFLLSAPGDMTLRLHNTRPDLRLAMIDAAMSPPAAD